jgi:N6-adenosine-specific RNA methylase IME4
MLPPLPPLGLPKCDVCKLRGPARFVDTSVGRFKLCDTCEAPDVLHVAAMGKLPALPALPALPSLAPLSAPKAATQVYAPPGTLNPLQAFTERVRVDAGLYADCPPARILVADPPWQFGDSTPHKGADDHYKTLPIDEIKAFPLPPLADDAVLFMWRVGGGSEKDGSLGEQAYAVMRAWGFTPKSEMCWQKIGPCKVCGGNGYGPLPHPPPGMEAALSEIRVWCDNCKGRGYKNSLGMGRYVRGAHEVCLIGTRGKPQFPDDKGIHSVFRAPRGVHSAKPDLFYDIVEQLYETGPYVELFARRRREGWHCFGDELPPQDA